MRGTTMKRFARAAIVPLAAMALVGYGGVAVASGAPQTPTEGTKVTVRVKKTNLGKILVDSKGRTLYLFLADTGTTSTCSDACAANWPPLQVSGTPKVGKGAKASLAGTTQRPDGASQVTYNGHPLYRFEGDRKAGQTNGQGVDAFGAQWFVLSPAGISITRQPSSSGGSSSGGGTSGY
jgi:predicted lipoprotein with Yx(FWY)xxD motif